MISAIFPCSCAVAAAGNSVSAPAPTAAAPKIIVNLLMFVLPRPKRPNAPDCSSNPLRQSDRHPATGTDRRSQQRVARSGGSARHARDIPVLELLRAKLGDVGGELGIVVVKLVELAR